jgi:hypothetical protein
MRAWAKSSAARGAAKVSTFSARFTTCDWTAVRSFSSIEPYSCASESSFEMPGRSSSKL